MPKLDGPAPADDKALHQALRASGVSEAEMPAHLRNSVVHRSRKGPLGAIVLRRISGVQGNAAAKTLRTFEANVGGTAEVAEKLAAVEGELSAPQKALLAILQSPTNKKGLTRLVAETGCEPVAIMNAYARGCIELGKVEAAIAAHRNLPAVAEELIKLALSKRGVCDACGGAGLVHAKPGMAKDTVPCTWCEGKGLVEADKLKSFGIDRVLEMTGQRTKAPMVQVNQGVQVNTRGPGAGAGSIFERVVQATDRILYKREEPVSRPADVVEGEVVNERV